MSKTIQVRNVPNSVHRVLKARAAKAGLSLSGYLLRQIRQEAERPTLDQWLKRLKRKRRDPVKGSVGAAEMIRAHRDA